MGAKEVKVNLLQYADDTIFVGEFNVDNVVVLKSIMRCFELVSDLKMNIHNSRFGSIGVGREDVKKFSKYLNCRILTIPFVYLGILLVQILEGWRLQKQSSPNLTRNLDHGNKNIFSLSGEYA